MYDDNYNKNIIPNCQRVILLGLDGAPWNLLNHWILSNKLPTFKKIINLGSKGILKSTIPCTTSPAVLSLFTGMNPGNLGFFSFIKPDGSPISIGDSKYDKLWNLLEMQNCSSCVVNVPLSYPPERIRGVMLSGWIPSMKSNYVYPKDLREDTKKFFNDRIEKEKFKLRDKKRNKKDRKKLLNLLYTITENRYSIFKELNQKQIFDLSILWIEQTDFLQHCCWEYKKTLLQYYIKIDDILSDILSIFPDRNLFIVSDHGFEHRPKRFFFVNTWLRQQGYLDQGGGLINYFINFGQFFSYNYLPNWLIRKILARLQSMKYNTDLNQNVFMENFDFFSGLDLEKSKVYLKTLFGINIKKSNNYDMIREKIITKMRNLKDERGEKVVRNVWKKEEVFKGKYLKEIPDIIFLTSEKYAPFPSLTKNLFGKIKRTRYWWQSGEHYRARDGILIAFGPAIRKNINIIHASIEDIVPTILHLMGFSIPRYIDGNVLINVCKTDRKPNINQISEVHENLLGETYELEMKEKEKIIERLKKLGYIS